MNNKGFVSVLIAIVITALVSGSVLYYWQGQEKKKSESRLAEIETLANKNVDALQEKLNQLEQEIEVKDEVIEESNLETYTNEALGFSFQYPKHIETFASNEIITTQDLHIYFEIEKIEDMMEVAPSYLSKEWALFNKAYLDEGDIDSVKYDWGRFKRLVNLGKVNAADLTALSRFEVGSVVFERMLLFFVDDHKVLIKVYGPVNDILDNSPEYFYLLDPEMYKNGNREDGYVYAWKSEEHDNYNGTEEFINDLKAGNGSDIAQEWYDVMDGIIDTFKFLE